MLDQRNLEPRSDAAAQAESAGVTKAPAEVSPHLSFSAGDSTLKPPVRPFTARPFFKAHLFTKTLAVKTHGNSAAGNNQGKIMSDRFTSDRMAAFTPQVPRRIADIPGVMRAAEADSEGKRLVVGKPVRMSGEIVGCERLIVEGHVDATLSEVKIIEIVAGGTFKGSAEVDSAVIAGAYEGSLKVRGHLEIAATGSIKGAVSYKTIMVANGGRVEGTIETVG